MNAKSTVSVIIPVYNGEKYVREAVESVRCQGIADIELILVDDGSTDGTSAVLRDIGGERTTIITRENGGIGAARNSGLEHVSGDLVAFLDADDVWLPRKLERQIDAIMRNPDTLVFGMAEEFISPDLDEEERAKVKIRREPQPAPMPSAFLARRETVSKVGRFNESLKAGEFIDWMARAGEAGYGNQILPDVVLKRRVHASNNGRIHAAEYNCEYLKVLRSSISRRKRKEQSES